MSPQRYAVHLSAPPRPTSAASVVHDVSIFTGVTPAQIFGRSRRKTIVAARHEVWARLHRLGWSLSALGRAFDRDHTTILAALSKPARARV